MSKQITNGHAAVYPHAPMLPEPPDCGAPCGCCEALAHDNGRLRAENAALEQALADAHHAPRECLDYLLKHKPENLFSGRQ